MRELLVIANARAGSAVDDTVEAVVTALSAGATVDLARPDGPDELLEVLRGRAGRQVAVLGGDGSLHLVAQSLYDLDDLSDAVLGLVPLGTGNDFARTVGVPLDSADAAQVILEGAPHAFDLFVDDDGGVVVNAVHVGVGAEAAKEGKDLKPKLGKLAYTAGAAKAGATAEGWQLEVVVDGVTINGPDTAVLMVGIANGTTVGGGTGLAPDARPDDGLADIVVSRALGPVARVSFAAQLALGRHLDRDDVVTTRGREIRVSGQPAPVNTDGELEDDVDHRTWRVLPAAWRLIIPPE
jgi:YegS/Rv2252/BmrU family lipid kinase